MKHVIVILLVLFRVSLAFAELPLSLTEALFEITGGEDYDQWIKLHGAVKFQRKFSCFEGGVFRSRLDKNPPFGLRYEIVMRHEFAGETNVVEVVPDIKKAEGLLIEKFKSSRFDVTVSSNKYHSACRDIDRRGWTVDFTITQIGETNAPIAVARFFNPLHKKGRSRSCEDFADASKFSPAVHETLSQPLAMGGWNVQMIGSGVCKLGKPFFLFDVMKFKSSPPTATGLGDVYEIEMEYEKQGATNINMAVSAIKDAEKFLTEYFIQSPFESKRRHGHYTSFCEGVDRCGWRVDFTVAQDTNTDKYIAHALFKRNVSTDASAGNVPKDRQIELYAEETGRQNGTATRDDVYVAVTTNAFNPLVQKLGVRPYPVDLHVLKEETRYDMSSKCVLMLMLPSEYDKKIVNSLVRCCGIQVAFVSPNKLGKQKFDELKTLIDLMIETHDVRMSKEKQIASGNGDEIKARHRKILDTELFGPYHVENLTLVEAVESLFLRVNGDLQPWDFGLGMGLGLKGSNEGFRYTYQIPRAHVAEIFSYAAAQMNCTVTNDNGFISFTYKSTAQEDQDDDK